MPLRGRHSGVIRPWATAAHASIAPMTTQPGADELIVRPWGWPVLLVAAAVAVFTVVLIFGGWPALLLLPVLVHLVVVWGLSSALVIHVDGDVLTWRTALGREESRVDLVMAVEHARGYGSGTLRRIHLADGQDIRVGEGPELDRLVRLLSRRVPDLQINFS